MKYKITNINDVLREDFRRMNETIMDMKLKDFIGAKVKYVSQITNRKRTGVIHGLRNDRALVTNKYGFVETVQMDSMMEVIE